MLAQLPVLIAHQYMCGMLAQLPVLIARHSEVGSVCPYID